MNELFDSPIFQNVKLHIAVEDAPAVGFDSKFVAAYASRKFRAPRVL